MFSPFEQLKSMFISNNCFGKDFSITNMTIYLFHIFFDYFGIHLATRQITLVPNNWQSFFEMIIPLFKLNIRTSRS
jgi:F0F1-type ATP synthase membrane subunit a